PKILCVDDSSTVLNLVRTILTRAGMEVITASSGDQCLEMLSSERPDAVLLDMHMPGMDGLETLKRMNADPASDPPPVMMLTGSSDDEAISAARALGARDFMTKPFEIPDLRERVRRLVTP
ncbi:MAG: response regulator, partial [Chloroflexi bacterium]|nr:response regulator [Chloroflexota bacterium]